jgi:hypothetical protein
MRNAYNILVRKPGRNSPLEKDGWKVNVALVLKERGYGLNSSHIPLKISAPAKQGSAHHWKFFKMHIGPRFAHSF